MTVTLSSSLTDVSFSKQPASIVRSIEKDVETYTFSTGDVELLDKFKISDRLTLTFTEYGDVFNKIYWINEIMDDQISVELSGLDDSNFNVPYLISDLNCEQGTEKYYIEGGSTTYGASFPLTFPFTFSSTSGGSGKSEIYDITIIFERMYDRLG